MTTQRVSGNHWISGSRDINFIKNKNFSFRTQYFYLPIGFKSFTQSFEDQGLQEEKPLFEIVLLRYPSTRHQQPVLPLISSNFKDLVSSKRKIHKKKKFKSLPRNFKSHYFLRGGMHSETTTHLYSTSLTPRLVQYLSKIVMYVGTLTESVSTPILFIY